MKLKLFIAAIITSLVFTGCSKDDIIIPQELIGTWKAIYVGILEYETNYDDNGYSAWLIGSLYTKDYEEGEDAPILIINENRTYEQRQPDEEAVTGTWESTNGHNFITVRNDTKEKAEWEWTISSDVISMFHILSEDRNANKMIMEQYSYKKVITE
ncbi:MAG: hypothetical protein LBP63_11435 [Prevotellaceae bacterium]|jgi:hypothetical protein|nr:hypothetical protein [Prevotellaceae bacterium]